MEWKKKVASMMEWIRPSGLFLAYFLAYAWGNDPTNVFHFLAPAVVLLMSGTVAFESLVLGEVASEKIGYQPNRAYQVQSGLSNLATALTAVVVFVMDWGKYAEATVVTAMLLFFVLSALNHTMTAVTQGNFKPVNLLRPVLTIILVSFMLPPMIKALAQ